MKKELKGIRELRDGLWAKKQSLSLHINYILNGTYDIDFDVWLPTKNMNLQRPFVWETWQKRELIHSILLKRFIPSVSVVIHKGSIDKQKNDVYCGCLQIIDGKQRIGAILGYINNGFTLDLEGDEYLFSELPKDYQRVIKGFWVEMFILYDYKDEPVTDQQKIDWFKMINFNATPQDKEHLAKFD